MQWHRQEDEMLREENWVLVIPKVTWPITIAVVLWGILCILCYRIS